MWQSGYSAKASLNFWLLVMTCASASAADLAPAAPLPPLPWEQASWTGFYVGAGGGLSSLNNKINAQPGPDPSSPLSASLNGLGATGTLATTTRSCLRSLSEFLETMIFTASNPSLI
jgi:hypothetical protein